MRDVRLLICIDSILSTDGIWRPPAERVRPRRPYSNDVVVTWCNMSTKTFVAVTPQTLLPLDAVNNTLTLAKEQITVEVNNLGAFRESYSLSPIVKNVGRVTLTIVGLDTGSLTWLMSYDAVLELLDWMSSTQTWVGVQFEIWHGIRRVGGGTLQQGARTVPTARPGPRPAGHG